ncbi:lymnokinin receptor [Plakobranchus ocellatus]|uniref:Lymnokinin receptor n=1 Tax=Plakobranchus ocellatus TaxID=259542 RepID=A0AAV3Z1K7_9GAST|nr:lymnokinin receptor [Plakobranchus ocellatus]
MSNLSDIFALVFVAPGARNASGPNSTRHDLDPSSTAQALLNNTGALDFEEPVGTICLLAILYGSISLLAVFGNALVILVIVKNIRMHTVTNIFIANLAVADVTIGLLSIPFQFQAALLQRWVLANFLCSICPFVQYVTVNVSVFTLSVIAIDRYIAVLHPFKAGCSKRLAAFIITVIWGVAIGYSIPVPMYYWVENMTDGTESKDQCLIHPPEGWPYFFVFYNISLVSIQYIMPLLVITFCYCRIAWHIWGSRRPGAHVTTEDVRGRNKRKVVKMMIIVVCLFVLCWLPLQTYNLWVTIDSSINGFAEINIIWFVSNWFAMSNSCYNPFIYGLLNEKFKREFIHLFGVCRCFKNKRYYTENLEEGNASRRGTGNYNSLHHHNYLHMGPGSRHGAVRYNFCRDDKRSFPRLSHPLDEDTETSTI